MKIFELPSQEHLRSALDYDPLTGVLRWRYRVDKHSRWNGACAGKVAGSVLPGGYVQISIDGQKLLAHRIIFKWMTGRDPGALVDHKNNNPSDNRWCNLREANVAKNSQNKRMNRIGLKGTRFRKGAWEAQIEAHGKGYYLGRFSTEEAAHAAYCAAAHKYHGEFTNTGGCAP